MLNIAPTGVLANAAISSVVSGSGASLDEGLSTRDGEIKINFAQAMDSSTFTADNVNLESITRGTAIDFGEVGTFPEAANRTYLFPTEEAFGEGTYWFDFSGALQKVEMGFNNSVLLYGRSFLDNGSSNDHFRVWIQRLDAGNGGTYRVYWSAGNYNNYVNVSDASVRNFDLKLKMTLTETTNNIDVYYNGAKLNSSPISGSLNKPALAGAVRSGIAVFCYTPGGEYDRHVYFGSMKCAKGETEATATPIANYDFTNLSSLEELGIDLPEPPSGTSYLRLAQDAEYMQDIAYRGSLSADGMTYTMQVDDIADGTNCRLSLSGLKDAQTGAAIADTAIDFIASDSVSSGKNYAHIKAGAGYDLDENPVLYYKNQKVVVEFDEPVSSVDTGDIVVGKYEKTDVTKFKYTAARTENQYGYLTSTEAKAHDPSKNVVFEVNMRPYNIGENASGWFRIYVGSKYYQMGYNNIQGGKYVQMSNTPGQLVESGEWYNFKTILKPTGYDFYMNGKLVGSASPGGYDFAGDLKYEYGSYSTTNAELEYDVKDARVYYEDGSEELISVKYDSTYNGLPSDIYCTVSTIKDEIIISDKLAAEPVLSADGMSCEIRLPELEKNADYAVIIDGIDGIASKTSIFRTDEYFSVDGLFSVSDITDAGGRSLVDIPYLSNKAADFRINVNGAQIDEGTITSDTVNLVKFERDDMAYINQTVQNKNNPYGKTVNDTISTHSKTKPVIIEVNMIPITAQGASNFYFNIAAGTKDDGTANGNAQLSYNNNQISLANGTKTNISDGKLHNIRVKIDADQAYLYVDGINTYNNSNMNYNGNITMTNSFYSTAIDAGTDKLEAYIKDIKVYEEGEEDAPFVYHSVKTDGFALLCENPECSLKSVEYGETDVEAKLAYENNAISVKPVKALGYLAKYRLNITDGLRDTNGISVVNPVQTEFTAVYSEHIYADNLKVTKTDTGYEGEYKIVNFTDTAESAVVILAIYDGNGLLDAIKKTVQVAANSESTDNTVVYTADKAIPDNARAVLYVWEDLTNILPVSPATIK